jgi:hypothetical protein
MSQSDFAPAAGTPAPGAAVGSASSARSAIARAAQATGVDFSYLLGQARLESSLDPRARAATSSAAGLYQFTRGTWARMLDRHGAEIGVSGGGPGGTLLGQLNDPAARARLMAMRFDPQSSAMMAAELANDNRAALTGALGRDPQPAELYLAHCRGADGAVKFLTALAADPGQSATAVLPRAAAANHTVFFDNAGAPRSLGSVMAAISGRLARAMDGDVNAEGAPGGIAQPGFDVWDASSSTLATNEPPSAVASGGPIAREFAAARSAGGNTLPAPSPATTSFASTPSASSMSDTLHATFSLGGTGGAAPDFVRAAYGRLRALGL